MKVSHLVSVFALASQAFGLNTSIYAAEIGLNSSFFADFKRNSQPSHELEDMILARNQYLEMRQQYDDMNRDYEMRSNFGLVNLATEQAHQAQLNDFSKNILNQVGSHQIQVQTETLQRNTLPIQNMLKSGIKDLSAEAVRSGVVKTLEAPAVVAVTMYSVYSGKTILIPFSSDTRMTSRTDIPGQAQHLQFLSPILNGGLDFQAGAPAIQDSGLPPGGQGERVTLSVSRNIPILNLASGLSYGSSSRTVHASLSRQIIPSLSMAVGTTQGVDSTYTWNEGSVSLNYGIRF